MTHPSIQGLQELLPGAAIETSNGGEVVIWTGWAVDHKNPDGPLVDWCENCKSGAALLTGEMCTDCGRQAEVESA